LDIQRQSCQQTTVLKLLKEPTSPRQSMLMTVRPPSSADVATGGGKSEPGHIGE
jgi:hypothetical protein